MSTWRKEKNPKLVNTLTTVQAVSLVVTVRSMEETVDDAVYMCHKRLCQLCSIISKPMIAQQ